MTPDTAWAVPYIIDPHNLAIDAVVAFIVSVLLAVMINAEGQAFMAAFLGDSRVEAKDRFHFNAFLHLDILGGICYLVHGFGWPRTMAIDRSKFAHPRLYTVVTRLAGPLANLLLAGIGGSIVSVMKSLSWDPRVFLMVVGVNLTTAFYNMIPIPPLTLGFLLCELFPASLSSARAILVQAGPYLIIALALLDRITHGIISPYIDPMIKTVFVFFKGA